MSNYFVPSSFPGQPAPPAGQPGAQQPNPAAYNPMAAAAQQYGFAQQQQQAYQHFQAATTPQAAQTGYGIFGSTQPAATTGYTTGQPQQVQQQYQQPQQQPPPPAAVAPAAAKSSTYSGYDAAVYAAATSYLQSKTSAPTVGAQKQWMGLKTGGITTNNPTGTITNATGKSFPHKTGGYQSRYGGGSGGGYQNRSGGVQQLHYCDVCKISCAGPSTYKEHLEGSKHKKKEAAEKSAVATGMRTQVGYKCELCGVTCSNSDSYNSHVKGAKHMKTLKLHQQLGKPIPASNGPELIAPKGTAAEVKNALAKDAAMRKVVGVPNMSFVGGNKLVTTNGGLRAEVKTASGEKANDDQTAAAYAAIMAEDKIQPVGEAYIEKCRDPQTNVMQLHCKLCDCNFTDVNAKDVHLKGRRHRLAYKKKVDPSLEVDVKPTFKSRRNQDDKNRRETMRMRQQEMWSMRANYSNHRMAPLSGALAAAPPAPFGPVVPVMGPRGETLDDTHIMQKHEKIYPSEDELSTVQSLVITTEKALKNASDWLHEEALETAKKENAPTDTAGKTPEPERYLKGVMRVGLLAKGLLLKGDSEVELVVLCAKKPTKTIVSKICDKLPEFLKKIAPDTEYTLNLALEDGGFTVATSIFTAKITFTCPLHREEVIEADEGDLDASDLIDKTKCLGALAELRHAKWFQARVSNLQPALIVLRIMRDICQRINTWTAMPCWNLELLIEKVLSSAGQPLSPGDAIRRTFEAVASGVLLPMGAGLLDPCEKESTDAVAVLDPQRREDITSSAQHALRLIAFNQLYKILAIDRYDPKKLARLEESRKRAAEVTDAGCEAKKSAPDTAAPSTAKTEVVTPAATKVSTEVPASISP